MNYTKNFSIAEMACPCGNCSLYMDLQFMERLQKLRSTVKRKLIINSAARCAEYNQKVGGVDHSYHTKGRAVDIRIDSSVERGELVFYAMKLGFGGVGVAKTFVHLDDRYTDDFPTMWVYE